MNFSLYALKYLTIPFSATEFLLSVQVICGITDIVYWILNIAYIQLLSEIRQRTAAQRSVSPALPVSNQGPAPQVPVSPGPPKDTSAPGGPPERTVTSAVPSNMLPRRLGSPATSVPGMGKQST